MEEHAWLVPTITRLLDLLRYPDRANEFGSRKVTVRATRAALLLLMRGMTDDAPAPRLEPTADGGLRFEWLEYWMDIVLVVGPEGSAKASVTVLGNVPETTSGTGIEDAAATLDVGILKLVRLLRNPPSLPSGTTARQEVSALVPEPKAEGA